MLIADDNYAARVILENMLQRHGAFEIDAVGSSDMAVDAVVAKDYEVILMDVRMPPVYMDGIEAIKLIRKISDTPVIVISAYGDKKTRERAKEAGANVFLTKPFDITRLMVEIKRVTRKQTRPLKEQTIMREKMRRLNILKEKKAALGISAPAELIMEIEDLEQDIADATAAD